MYPCWSCGKLIDGDPKERCFCPDCAVAKGKQAEADFNEYMRLKNKMMLERAVKRLEETEDSDPSIYDYKEAIDTVGEYLIENPTTIASTEECLALIDILHNRTQIKCQYKVLSYRVDFLLPQRKIVLEVDGERHNSSQKEDVKRDLRIIKELGPDWEIVRIPTKYINQYPKRIYTAVLSYRNEKRRIRKQGGKEQQQFINEALRAIEVEDELRKRNKAIMKARRIYGL